MIYGTGNDITDIRRIKKAFQRHGERFLQRCFTEKEISVFSEIFKSNQENSYAYLAKRYAAKEACSKALGTGFVKGISMRDFEITNDETGKPIVTISGKAKTILEEKLPKENGYHFHLSISDEFPYCIAHVTMEHDFLYNR